MARSAPRRAVPVGDDPIGIVAADFDGNGRADFAVTNAAPGIVSAFLRARANNGFTAEPPISVSAAPVGIDAADFDRDGRPDLAVAANAGAVEILRRNAGGGFTRDPVDPARRRRQRRRGGRLRRRLAARPGRRRRTPSAAADTFSVLLNPAPALPPPVAGKTVNVKPVSGKVKIKRRGSKRFVTLTAAAHIPVGSSIDTRRGRIAITAAQGKGKTASADFYDGLFKLTQTKGAKPITTLTLIEKLSCAQGEGQGERPPRRRRRSAGCGATARAGSGPRASTAPRPCAAPSGSSQDRCTLDADAGRRAARSRCATSSSARP